MQTQLIIFTFLLTAISDILCGRLGGLIANKCPSQEDIPRCKCEEYYGGIWVTCKDFPTDSEFLSNLKGFRGYLVKHLEIRNYNCTDPPFDSFKGLTIQELSLNNVELNDKSYTIDKRYFQGLENSLDTLEVKNSYKQHPLSGVKLDHLKKLKYINFEQNSILEVGNDWFTPGPKELKTIFFENNGIEEVGNEAFSALENLEVLGLIGNPISTISRSMLPKSATRLKALNFMSNKIRNLPKDIFSDMPKLQYVYLEDNLIHVIEEDTFLTVASQLKLLLIGENPLQCDEKMTWLCGTKLKGAIGMCMSPPEEKGVTVPSFCEGFNEIKKNN